MKFITTEETLLFDTLYANSFILKIIKNLLRDKENMYELCKPIF